MAKIPVDKTEQKVSENQKSTRRIEKMSEEMINVCDIISQPSKVFEVNAAFAKIEKYIDEYDRLLYSDISNYIFRKSEEEVSTFQTNLDAILEYVLSNDYENKIKSESNREKRFKIEKYQKVVLKMYDHVNLAKRQYSELKETDDDFEDKFKKSFANHQIEFTREMSNQLVTLVGIFTAVAFVVFGGITSLDNIFESGVQNIPLLKLMLTGLVWALCMTNLVYIFLFCVGKITKLSIKSSDNPDDNLVQKYPIIFWSNFIFISLLMINGWLYYLNARGHLNWFNEIADKNEMWFTIIGFIVIVLAIAAGAAELVRWRKKERK